MELPDWIDEPDRLALEAALVLLEAGPLSTDSLAERLTAAGHLGHVVDQEPDIGRDDLGAYVDELMVVTDKTWHDEGADVHYVTRQLFADRVLTCRLTEADVESESIEIGADLSAIDFGLDRPGRDETLDIGGDAVRRRFDPTTGRVDFKGPPGWMDGLSLGSLVAFRRQGETLQRLVVTAEDLADGELEGGSLAEFGASIEEGYGFEIWGPTLDLMASTPEAFLRPIAPLSELMAERGFELKGDWFGAAGTEWAPPGVVAREELRESIGERFQFDACCDEAFDEVQEGLFDHLGARAREAADTDAPVPETIDYRSIAAALAHGSVADGLVAWVEGQGMGGGESLAEFLRTLVATGRTDSAAAHYAIGKLADEAGDLEAAETAYGLALSTDGTYLAPHFQLAWIAFDRGDYDAARRHLGRLGYSENSDIFTLFPFSERATSAQGGAKVGRNEPCPCGSGKKYKVCHAGPRAATAVPPGAALTAKVTRFAAAVSHPGMVALALAAADGDFDRGSALMHDPFIADVAMVEGGLLEEFLDTRGQLLPDIEFDLAARIGTAPRDLFEIIEVEPNHSLTLRSVTDGGRARVTDSSAPKDIQVGDYVLLRLLTMGDDIAMHGSPVVVPLHGRDSLMAALEETEHGSSDLGQGLAAWYGQLTAPPTLVT